MHFTRTEPLLEPPAAQVALELRVHERRQQGRWGRVLMRRAERGRAEKAGETPRTLREIDYLLMVNDEARQGAPG